MDTTKAMKLIFTYGTLKQGFSNHPLLEDMISTSDALFLGPYRTLDNLPLVCGPYRVPFLLPLPGLSPSPAHGELYSVSPSALSRMDELEGLAKGHYERLPLRVVNVDDVNDVRDVEAYYAHRSYAEELWKRNGEEGFSCYTDKEATGYVRRKDRPKDVSFLDQIRLFVSSSA